MAIQICFDKGMFNVPEKCPKCDEGNMKYRQGRKTHQCSKKFAEKKFLFAMRHFSRKAKFQLN